MAYPVAGRRSHLVGAAFLAVAHRRAGVHHLADLQGTRAGSHAATRQTLWASPLRVSPAGVRRLGGCRPGCLRLRLPELRSPDYLPKSHNPGAHFFLAFPSHTHHLEMEVLASLLVALVAECSYLPGLSL